MFSDIRDHQLRFTKVSHDSKKFREKIFHYRKVKSMDEMTRARVESIIEMTEEIKEAIIKASKKHGDDPNLGHIVSSSLTLAIRDINKIAPGFTGLMRAMLENEDD